MNSSIIYILIEGIVRGIPFIALPVFISILSKEEYGVMSLYISLLPLLAIVFDMAQRVAIKRFYYDYPRQIDNFITTIIIGTVFISFCISILLYIFDLEIISNSNTFLIFINIFMYVIIEQYLTKLQISKQVKSYNIIYFIRNAMPYVISVLILFTYNQTHLSLVYAQILLFFFTMIYLIQCSIKKVNLSILFKNIKKYSLYSFSIAIPVLPVVMSAYILSVSDRYMIEYFYGYNEVAEYSLAYTIAMIVQLFVLAIGKAWQPFIFESLKNKQYSIIKRNSFYYSFVIAVISIAIYLLSEPLVLFLSNDDYLKAIELIPILLCGIYFFFLYSMLSNIVFFYKKMFLFALPAIIAAITNVCLNYYFLPLYGYEVATWTTLVSYAIEFIIIVFIILHLIRNIKKEVL